MKLIIFGDQHFSKNDPFNLHQLKIKFFREFVERRQDADYVLISGDFNDVAAFDTDLQTELANILLLAGTGLNRWLYVFGNHGLRRSRSEPILPFVIGTNANVKGMTIVDHRPLIIGNIGSEPDVAIQGWNTEPIPELDARFYISHRFVYYSEMPSVILEKRPNEPKAADLQNMPYERLIFNDVHKRIDEGKVHSVGVGFASDFKDIDQVSGYGILEYDNKTSKFYREDFADYPIFKKFVLSPDSEYPDEQDVKGNVVRVELSGPHSWNTYELRKEVESYLRSMQPYYLDVRQVDTQSEKVQVAVAADLKSTEQALNDFMVERNWTPNMKKILRWQQ